jgi:nitrous oxidase accessory protein NosD
MTIVTRCTAAGVKAGIVLAAMFALAVAGAVSTAAAHGRRGGPPPGRGTLYVSTKGRDTGNCATMTRACATIGYALSQASAGDHILVEPGTYSESKNPRRDANVIGPRLTGVTVAADRAHGATAANTVIDATGEKQGIVVEANRATVDGFTVENAQLEGILVEPTPSSWPTSATAHPANISQVTIENNLVEHDDQAYDTMAADPEMACAASPTDADDCGEGIHLLAATYSHVTGNQVSHNVGGVLLSDGGLAPTSVGPSAHDVIEFNTSTDNAFDCGITLPSHDPRAVSAQGRPQPSLAGVYDNVVKDNVSERNGGAGLLDAAPYPGTGSYDNTFTGNLVADNGEGGFQLHSHATQQDVNGNRVIGNRFATNNLAGDPDSGDMSTTGIILFSAAVPVTGTRIFGNEISGDAIGIWKTANVATNRLRFNAFSNVGDDVFTK